MYNFKDKTCTNHKNGPQPLKFFLSPLGVKTLHCPDCVNILELGFKEIIDLICQIPIEVCE